MNTSHFDIVVLGGRTSGLCCCPGLVGTGVFGGNYFTNEGGVHVGGSFTSYTGTIVKQTIDNLGSVVRRQANWNGLSSTQNTEWVVERRRFDAVLRQETNTMGVAVIPGLVRKTMWNGDSWSVLVCSQEVKKYEFYCKFIIEARGRRAPTAPKGLTQGPVTTALRSYWLHHGNVCAMTGVTSFADGWAWYAAGNSGRATLQLIVSGEKGGIPGSQVLGSHYDKVVRAIPEARQWLAGATRYGKVSARSASARLASSIIDERQARVGDAAMAIDPLSGHGIYEALTSARALAPVVNTILCKPARIKQAVNFYHDRMQDRFKQICRVGRDFYAEEQRWSNSRFWEARRQWPAVQSAHETRSGAAAFITRRTVIEGDFITEREVFVTAGEPRGVWVVADVLVVQLYSLLQNRMSLDVCASHLGTTLEQARLAKNWLVRNSLLS